MRVAIFIGILLAGSTAFAQAPAEESCRSLIRRNYTALPDAPTALKAAGLVAAGSGQLNDLPAYCRIEGVIAPRVTFELRLPTENWNGKFLMQGCGGMCGILNMEAAEDSLIKGYAVVNTDMGHSGTGGIAIYAYNDRQSEIDFGYRATHVVAAASKVIVSDFYGKAPLKSYFNGCSTGGRQAMVEAQRFPHNFDGIIAGAPVLNEIGDGTLHLLWSARANLGVDGRPILSSKKLPMIRKSVLAACDKIDGVEDDILQDPRRCTWKPSNIQCRGDGADDCLTAAEVAVVERVYSGAHDSQGRRLFPGGMSLGSEYEWSPAFIGVDGPGGARNAGLILSPGSMIYQFLQYLTFFEDPGPAYDPMAFNFDRDPLRLMLTETLYNAQNPDLRAFKAAGGKAIMYHGWDDMEIPPGLSVDYYETVTRTLGGERATRDFFRLFMIPGMAHCRRGPGADGFDPVEALERWVERAEAPEFLLTHKMVKDQPYAGLPRLRFPLKQEDFTWTRPAFAYPDVAVHTGRGDWRDPKTWRARRP